MYPESLIIPMREQLVRAGIKETRTTEEVDAALALSGTTLLAINAICDCAASKMRPGLRLALKDAAILPDHMITVFAGQDIEATERARSFLAPHPPSSPAIAILRNGKLVYLMDRDQIDAGNPQLVAKELRRAMNEFCSAKSA
jgi:putative YphP/YqiW family bacilliredoxin